MHATHTETTKRMISLKKNNAQTRTHTNSTQLTSLAHSVLHLLVFLHMLLVAYIHGRGTHLLNRLTI